MNTTLTATGSNGIATVAWTLRPDELPAARTPAPLPRTPGGPPVLAAVRSSDGAWEVMP